MHTHVLLTFDLDLWPRKLFWYFDPNLQRVWCDYKLTSRWYFAGRGGGIWSYNERVILWAITVTVTVTGCQSTQGRPVNVKHGERLSIRGRQKSQRGL